MKRELWLVGAVLLAYGSSVPGDFVWLDHMEIERAGYRVEGIDDLSTLFRDSLDRYLIRDRVQAAEATGGYFRPLYALSVSADWFLFGARPALFHCENVVWHLLVVLLLYALGLRVFRELHRGDTVAFAAALLFAVHPVAIQSVTWISGRKDTMCAAFTIAALLALLRASDAVGWKRYAGWSVGACCAAILASLSKELGLLIPVLATGMIWIGRPAAAGGAQELVPGVGRRRSAHLVIGLWLTAAAALAYRVLGVGVADLNAARPADSLWGSVATSATVLWRYVGAVLTPSPPRLSDAWPIAHSPGLGEIAAVLGLVAVAGVAIAVILRRGPAAFSLLWLGVLAAPASGLVPLRHFHAERYLYPAYWGLLSAVLIALLHGRLLDRLIPAVARRPDASSWGWGALAVVVIATAGVTATSNLVWWSDETLFRDAVQRDPHYVEGRLGLALHSLQAGELEEAVAHSRRAIEEGNDRSHTAYWAPFVAHLNLAGALEGLRRPREAYAAYSEALRYRPDDARVLCRAGRIALSLSRPGPAMEHLARAALHGSLDFECDLARAQALAELGQWGPALVRLTALTVARPRNLVAHKARIRAQLELNQIGPADDSLRSLLRLAPQRADLQALQAWVLFRKREVDAATEAWHSAYALDPSEPLLQEVMARFQTDFPQADFPQPPPSPAPRGDGG